MKKLKKKIYKYTVIFEPQKEGGFTVYIPSLPGCISEGDTFEDALKNIKKAADLYLSVMKEREKDLNTGNEEMIVAPIQIPVYV